jgi:hypothetical protein
MTYEEIYLIIQNKLECDFCLESDTSKSIYERNYNFRKFIDWILNRMKGAGGYYMEFCGYKTQDYFDNHIEERNRLVEDIVNMNREDFVLFLTLKLLN